VYSKGTGVGNDSDLNKLMSVHALGLMVRQLSPKQLTWVRFLQGVPTLPVMRLTAVMGEGVIAGSRGGGHGSLPLLHS